MPAPRITLVDRLADAEHEMICGWLRDHNLAMNGEFMTAREQPENAPWPLVAVALDDAGNAIGGLIAETQFAWLKISIVAVAPSARGQGVGRALLAAAELEA